MAENFYLISVCGPYAWGLASDWLLDGWNYHRQSDGLLSIDRTGPYIPPITMPRLDCVIVSTPIKQWLATGILGQFEFRPVVKRKIVEMEWHTWNEDSDDDIVIPYDVDLETYFETSAHSEAAADKMGEIWEWIIPKGATVDIDVKESQFVTRKRVHLSTWNGAHVFRGAIKPESVGFPIADQFGKDMLESQELKYVLFKECLLLP